MKLVADEKVIFESPCPESIYCYTPAVILGEGRRLIVVVDLGGPGTNKLEGPRSAKGDYKTGNQIRVFLSDDGGAVWRESSTRIPMMHETLFRAGQRIYMVGHAGKLQISCSDDNGETWSEPQTLEDRHDWHQSCAHVEFANGKVYLVYEWHLGNNAWPDVALVMMSASADADLLRKESWTFSAPFDPATAIEPMYGNGACMFKRIEQGNGFYHYPGILESNLIAVRNPKHPFFDPFFRSFMILARARTGFKNQGAILKGVEHEDGSLSIERFTTKHGERLFFLPFPGGDLKFHLDYDPVSGLYWMVCSQIDGIHCDRRRLQLMYSPDCFNWTFAGMVAVGPSENGSRHYATLAFAGDDILIASRSGDERAKSAHDNNLLTFHRVRNFRSLVY